MKQTKIFLFTFFLFVLIGCGGGGGSYSTITQTPSNTPKIKKGYYVDAPISGVEYKCGAVDGFTKDNGEFSFEVGKDCTFSLGDIILRRVDAKFLEDGATILENNTSVEQLLLSLDIDGNNSNGIQITKDEIKIIQNSHINTISQESIKALIDDLNTTLEDFKGFLKDFNDVINHFKNTIKKKLASKTFYAVVDETNTSYYIKMSFNQDLSTLTLTNLENNTTIGTLSISFDEDNKLLFEANNHTYSLELLSASDTALVGAITIDDEEKIIKLFYDKKKAQIFYEQKHKIKATEFTLEDLQNAIHNGKIKNYNNANTIEKKYLAVINYLRSLPIECNDSQAIIGPSPKLNWDTSLEAAAKEHSDDMANRGYFSHTGSDGSSPVDRMKNHGFNGNGYGENIAWIGKSGNGVTYNGNEWQKAFIDLLHSPHGHCSNMMNPNFNYFGMAESKKESSSKIDIYWTQDFGKK